MFRKTLDVIGGMFLVVVVTVALSSACTVQSIPAQASAPSPYTGPVLVWEELPQPPRSSQKFTTWWTCWGPVRLWRSWEGGMTSQDTTTWPPNTLGKC